MTGRPKKEFDKQQFQTLCGIWCTEEEICSFFGTTDKTLNRWCKREYSMPFSECYKKYSQDGNISLRRAQRKKAIEDGNVPMLIWLGKQYLGQRDRLETNVDLADTKDDALSESLKAIATGLKSDDK